MGHVVVSTWSVDHADLAGISVRTVSVLGSLAAAALGALSAVCDLLRPGPWTAVMWTSVGVALLLAVVVSVTSRTLSGSGAAVFAVVADFAIAAGVAALADPQIAAFFGAGVLAILGNFTVFYSRVRGLLLHLAVAGLVSAFAIARVGLTGAGVPIAALTLWLSVGMHLLTLAIWSSLQRDASLAFHDPLTGAANRAGLERNFSYLIVETARRNGVLAAIVVDIDKFKTVNDTFVHAVGDLVLIELAQHLFGHFGATATIARIGGEEFVVLSYGEVRFVKYLVDTLTTTTAGYNTPAVSVSVGAAWCIAAGVEYLGLEAAIQSADRAMYEAKRQGGNTVRSTLD